MSLTDQTADQLSRGLADGQFTSYELTRYCLDRIDRCDPAIGAFSRVNHDGALAAAKASDQRRAARESRGPLDGIPLALKDNLCTAGEPTTCSSRMLAEFVPPYDATVVRKLRPPAWS